MLIERYLASPFTKQILRLYGGLFSLCNLEALDCLLRTKPHLKATNIVLCIERPVIYNRAPYNHSFSVAKYCTLSKLLSLFPHYIAGKTLLTQPRVMLILIHHQIVISSDSASYFSLVGLGSGM